ncbi:hypothetical protein VTK73DRAFT_4602 [Phialemonium thermophilum]|uniref:Ubiquitin-like protease family profile domain-containing protein n=1 Tax=Phialemonium thermophilum TaxID=223376 RepID=A0ABR3XYR9_9PEZI
MQSARKFLKTHLNRANGPVNTLYSSPSKPPRPNEAPAVSPSAADRPSTKRQKADIHGRYIQSRLAPADESDDSPLEQSGLETRGSQSALSVEDMQPSNRVAEYCLVSTYVDGQKPRRSGTRRGRQPVRTDWQAQDPIAGLSDDSHSGPGSPFQDISPRQRILEGRRGTLLHLRDPVDAEIMGLDVDTEVLPRPPKLLSSRNSRQQESKKRATVSQDLDELAGSDKGRSNDVAKRPHAIGDARVSPCQSGRPSNQADKTPSTGSPLYGAGLPVKGAIHLPDRIYSSPDPHQDIDSDKPCLLKASEGGLRPICVAFNEDGTPSSAHDWLKIDPRKLQRFNFSTGFATVKLVQPFSIDKALGRVMFVEFFSWKDARQVLLWVRRHNREVVSEVKEETLEKEFNRSVSEIKERLASKMAMQHARKQGDDEIRLLERKEALRQSRIPRPGTSIFGPNSQQATGQQEMPRTSHPDPGGSRPDHNPEEENNKTAAPARRSRPLTRSMDTSVDSVAELKTWSDTHPEWSETWRMPLVYHRTIIEKDDIPRLDEGQCLNDNIIGFYIQYLVKQLESSRPDIAKRVYFHNSFFYDKLKPTKGREINYEGVKSWTARVDILSFDYIVVPVNEHYHWWVAIICNPGRMGPSASFSSGSQDDADDSVVECEGETVQDQGPRRNEEKDVYVYDGSENKLASPVTRFGLLSLGGPEKSAQGPRRGQDSKEAVNLEESNDSTSNSNSQHQPKPKRPGKRSAGPGPRKYDPRDPRIITLDSLGTAHSPACTHLKQYLIREFKDKKNRDIEYPQAIGTRATNIPEQDNFCDCGVYLLGYIEQFLQDPDGFVQMILQKEQKKWKFDASEARNKLRELIFSLHAKYQDEQERLKRLKLENKRKRHAQQANQQTGPDETGRAVPQKVAGSDGADAGQVTRDSSSVKSPTSEGSRLKSPDATSETSVDDKLRVPANKTTADSDHPGTSESRRRECLSQTPSIHRTPEAEIPVVLKSVEETNNQDTCLTSRFFPVARAASNRDADDEVRILSQIPSSSPTPGSQKTTVLQRTSHADSPDGNPEDQLGKSVEADRGSITPTKASTRSPTLISGPRETRPREPHGPLRKKFRFSSPGFRFPERSRSRTLAAGTLDQKENTIDLTDD